jgi:hypothetical protein
MPLGVGLFGISVFRIPGACEHPCRRLTTVGRRWPQLIRPPNRSSLSLVTAALIGIAQMYWVTSLWAYIFLQPSQVAMGLAATFLGQLVDLVSTP